MPDNGLQSSHFSIHNRNIFNKKGEIRVEEEKSRLPVDVRGSKTSGIKGVLYLKTENNCVGQFWYHVKELRTLTSKMSFSWSHATSINE